MSGQDLTRQDRIKHVYIWYRMGEKTDIFTDSQMVPLVDQPPSLPPGLVKQQATVMELLHKRQWQWSRWVLDASGPQGPQGFPSRDASGRMGPLGRSTLVPWEL
jgi:hypothetical protein